MGRMKGKRVRQGKNRRYLRPGYIEITPERRAALVAERARTGRSYHSVIRHAEDPPPGLTKDTCYAWVRGTSYQGREEFYEFMMAEYAKLPGGPETPAYRGPDFIPLTRHRKKLLRSERERTGKSFYHVIENSEHPPRGLTDTRCRDWLSGRLKQAPRSHFSFMIGEYRTYPDASEPERPRAETVKIGHPVVFVTPAMLGTIREVLGGRSPEEFLAGRADIPEGLDAKALAAMCRPNAGKVRRDHYEYVVRSGG